MFESDGNPHGSLVESFRWSVMNQRCVDRVDGRMGGSAQGNPPSKRREVVLRVRNENRGLLTCDKGDEGEIESV